MHTFLRRYNKKSVVKEGFFYFTSLFSGPPIFKYGSQYLRTKKKEKFQNIF